MNPEALPPGREVEPRPDFQSTVLARVHRHQRQAQQRRVTVTVGLLTLCLLGTARLWLDRQAGSPMEAPRRLAAHRGVGWLLEHQQADGGWQPGDLGGHARFAPGVSALAVLAMLRSPEPVPREALDRGLAYLSRHLEAKRTETAGPDVYNHLLSVLSLLEADRLFPDPKRGDRLRRELVRLIRSQQPDGGWGYPGSESWGYQTAGDANGAVTWWACRLLRAGSSLSVDGASHAVARGEEWLRARVIGPQAVQYSERGGPVAGPADALFWMAALQVEALRPPALEEFHPESTDVYREWFRIARLGGHPEPSGGWRDQAQDGGWNQPDDRWWRAGGKVYTTACSVLMLAPGES